MVVDTSALLCILLDAPDAPRYAESLAAAPRVLVGAPTWLEASLVVMARLGPEGQAELLLLLEALQGMVVPFDEATAYAAYAGWVRFGRGRHPAGLNFGDCCAYAVAARHGEPLLYKGDDFARTDVASAL